MTFEEFLENVAKMNLEDYIRCITECSKSVSKKEDK